MRHQPRHPLDFLQVDHTPVDLILVDPVDREPIGRPWLTIAIDAYSRCIAGFHVSLEAPSAASVGLCLTHAAMDKASWLTLRGVEAEWPVAGKPHRLGVDNGPEFHSQAFERGCAQHGIAIEWRPPGQPHFGGIVERVIGTLMGLVHGLPGTTFSNVGQRGTYDSDKAACLTLEELERWLAVAIAKYYHLRPHAGLDSQLPLRRWQDGVVAFAAEGGAIPIPARSAGSSGRLPTRSSTQPAAERDQDRSSDLLQPGITDLDHGARPAGSLAGPPRPARPQSRVRA